VAPGIPLLVLVGPTSVGKTRLAVVLAEYLRVHAGGWLLEAVSADSRQIYRGMNIATAKPDAKELARLPHHLLDVVSPDEIYTLAQYQAAAIAAIAGIWARGRLPLLVGGTGLYVRAVVDGLAIPEVAPDPVLRARLEAIATEQGTAALHAQLAALDPVAAAHIDAANPRRLVRALEVCLVSGRPISEQQETHPTPYQTLKMGLSLERAELYRRADQRIDMMISAGLVEETRGLVECGYSWELPSMSSLGYREMGSYLRHEISLEAATERFKLDTHQYIRRQLTWFRSEKTITWLDAGLPLESLVLQVAALVEPWLGAVLLEDRSVLPESEDNL
jgi:tRNA dimethylallyltransferase